MSVKKNVPEERLKIYHFFLYGEIIESIEAISQDIAVQKFLNIGYSKRDFDFILEYNKQGFYIQSHL